MTPTATCCQNGFEGEDKAFADDVAERAAGTRLVSRPKDQQLLTGRDSAVTDESSTRRQRNQRNATAAPIEVRASRAMKATILSATSAVVFAHRHVLVRRRFGHDVLVLLRREVR